MPEDTKLIGQTGAVTGFETRDPKDTDPSTINTTTPADDRVGASDQGKYQPVTVPDAKEVTGQFDHLATRDPQAMEHHLQRPEYEGAESTAALGAGTGLVAGVLPSDGLGAPLSVGVVDQHIQGAIDPNPNYTPPSKMTPPHISEQTANRPGDDATVLDNLRRDEKL
ncbi:hypothetical protein D3875_11540 [Deinococcus cavernae]|uniref:Uncharacterized protein n=1 Tax=Deinococcus cavernae TaxID=2320857 RepID=A0A418V7L9_9DEIO|nr:hypothetical protein [Deinococcus cavernae]RJF72094.1 hypothetical protein D3875_11540 [Deinococcus cavernae]